MWTVPCRFFLDTMSWAREMSEEISMKSRVEKLSTSAHICEVQCWHECESKSRSKASHFLLILLSVSKRNGCTHSREGGRSTLVSTQSYSSILCPPAHFIPAMIGRRTRSSWRYCLRSKSTNWASGQATSQVRNCGVSERRILWLSLFHQVISQFTEVIYN